MKKTSHALVIGLGAVVLAALAWPVPPAWAQGSPASLVEEVRRATKPFHDVAAATSAGYAAFLGCVSGPQGGAMGIHYVNGDLVGDGKLDPLKPEALMYEPRGGKLHLVGVEYIVIAAAWDAANKTPPALLGQVFHHTPSPNRYGIPAFYALHVWAWKTNPSGMFVDWNPKVSCEEHTAAGESSTRTSSAHRH